MRLVNYIYIFFIKISIPQPSWGYFFNGRSLVVLATPLKEADTIWHLRKNCYLIPINGPVLLNVSCSPNSSSFS